MSVERARRDRFAAATPPPTWEGPAAVLLCGTLLVLTTPLLVQSAVSWLTTGQLAWPSGHLLPAYQGLLHGRFGGGLGHHVASELPRASVMWSLTGAGEVVALGAGTAIAVKARELTGGTSHHGLATTAQATEALGLPRLRRTAALIRPDLITRTPRRRR